jgi:hypothetical protein
MKKLLFILSLVVLFSCDKKNDAGPALSTSKLVGTWTAVSTETVMMIGDQTYEEYLISFGFSAEEAKDAADALAEISTLTGFVAEMEIKSDFTWTGDSEFVTEPVTGKWELSSDEKKITLTNDAEAGAKQQGTITKLNDTDLWIEVGIDKSQLPAGIPESFTYTSTLKFTRKK